MIRAILVVPMPGWRDRLLNQTEFGARVPRAWRWTAPSPVQAWRLGSPRGPARTWMPYERALALAWDGKPTGPEGLARALACLAEREGQRESRAACWGRPWPDLMHWAIAGPPWANGRRWSLTYAPGDRGIPALATPPDGLGDLLDLWALAEVMRARGLASDVVLIRGAA